MDTAVPPAEEETRTETHCYMCQQELPGDGPIITSKCGVNFHEDCAKRVVKCPVCGENMLEHFLSEHAKKKMVKKDRLYTILIFAIPFAIIEVLIGIWSMMNHPSEWSIPPWMGQAFIVDVLILIVGIIVAVLIIKMFGYKPDWKTVNVLVVEQKGMVPGTCVAGEQVYTCGYGGAEGRLDTAQALIIGDVVIPDKLGAQKENIITVGVDRLTKTPQGTFLWVNPRFLKLLKPKDTPRPSTPEELEQLWMMSGRTKIPGEEDATEERFCITCNEPLEYIEAYDAWYCTPCGKYQEQTEEPETAETVPAQEPLEPEAGEEQPPEGEQPPETGEGELPEPETDEPGDAPPEGEQPPEGDQPPDEEPPEEELPPPDDTFPPP
ncbi:MAG: hypothetical protein KAJ19_23440 [Gammaproteobacteria bacterium]|nr:hypothetical protein [Gammaproteobacteria bacterium]